MFRPRERARDIDAELTFHLQARIEHLRRDGVPDARGLVSSFLYGIEPTDVATLGISMAILVVVAGAASLLPAWRAAAIDPATILKAE